MTSPDVSQGRQKESEVRKQTSKKNVTHAACAHEFLYYMGLGPLPIEKPACRWHYVCLACRGWLKFKKPLMESRDTPRNYCLGGSIPESVHEWRPGLDHGVPASPGAKTKVPEVKRCESCGQIIVGKKS